MKTVLSRSALIGIVVVFLICLHIRFSLSLSISKHHDLFLFPIYKFIFLLKSSRTVVFFAFNVIVIVIIFFSSFKSSFKDDCDYCVSFPTSAYEANSDGNDYYEYYSEDEEEEYYHGSDGYDEDNDDDDDGSFYAFDDDEYVEEDKDIDLERRIEEFISKMNGIWREELRSEKLMRIAIY